MFIIGVSSCFLEKIINTLWEVATSTTIGPVINCLEILYLNLLHVIPNVTNMFIW